MSNIRVRIRTDDNQSIELDSTLDSHRTSGELNSASYPQILGELDRLRNDLARMWELEER